MNCLVIGYGSIGSRHSRILQELGCSVSVVSQRQINFPSIYQDVRTAVKEKKPTYIIIANPTFQHREVLTELLAIGFEGPILVEKPLFSSFKEMPLVVNKKIFVGYNLRFHPIIQMVRELLVENIALSVQIYAGQYLPLWRPMRNYQESYSARKEMGGGVIRDLSHELDYINWLFGGWKSIIAMGGNYSNLQINSDDVYHLMVITNNCPLVSLQLNYLDRIGRREIIINTNQETIKADLNNNILQINEQSIMFNIDRNDTYRAMHLAIMEEDYANLSQLADGLAVLKMIDSAEQSIIKRQWVNNDQIMHNLCQRRFEGGDK